MTERETMLWVWSIFSVLWVAFAALNLTWASIDLYVVLSDNPTEDEKTIAWQRWRNNTFRLYLALIFTLTGFLTRESTTDSTPRVRTAIETAYLYSFVSAPIVGAIFEGWSILDRTRMEQAYKRLYGRKRENG